MAVNKFILIPLLFLASQAQASNEWTGTDTALEATYLALHAVDWGQTLYISSHPLEHWENNRILGDTPSRGEVNRYFFITGMAHVGISYLLPQPYRRYWQYAWIGAEVTSTYKNYVAGVKFDF